MQLPKELFDIFDGHPFDGDHCFLCGVELTSATRTIEHVFPRWLQEIFDLKDRTIVLLNSTRIPYRNLVIPCCKECNGNHLSKLENRIKNIIIDNSKSLDDIDNADLNAWLSKIYIGILWKELELSFDRRNPEAGPILPSEVMTNFRMTHFFMQACRKKMKFHGLEAGFPNSLLRLECSAVDNIENFDYLDNFTAHTVGLRMGNRGVIGVFDGGLHDLSFPNFPDMQFDGMPLHPIQFKEVFAKLTYKSMLCLRVPYYSILYSEELDQYNVDLLAFDDQNMSATSFVIGAEDGLITVIPIVPQSAIDGPSYDKWSQEDYAKVLSVCTGIPFNNLFHPPDLVRTTLRDDEGKFIKI